jgi:D-lactate dehydrogenase (cytochrome)
VGGMCATRCSGSTAVKYGSMRENVLNLTAVLADGTIIRTGSRARKSSAGYDITRLLIGSEGTLAVITEATLKVYPIPAVSYAVRVAFPSVAAAARCASDTLRKGLSVGRCELMDEVMVRPCVFIAAA